MSKKQVINRINFFRGSDAQGGRRAQGPYANKIGGGAFAKGITQSGDTSFRIISAEIGNDIPTQVRVCYSADPSVATCGTADTVFTNDSRAEVYPLQGYNSADANCLLFTTAFAGGLERLVDETSPADVVTLDYTPGTCAADADAGNTLPSYTDYPVTNSIYGPISAEIGGVANNIVVVTFPTDLASTAATWNVFVNDVLVGLTDTSIVSGVLQLTLNTVVNVTDVITYTQSAITLTSTPPRSVDGRYCWAFAKEPVTNQSLSPVLFAFGPDNGVLKGLVSGVGSLSFSRPSTAPVTDFEGIVRTAKVDELRFPDSRRVENLATGLVTETITVANANAYQLTIAGANGATAVCSGAFTGTLTSDGVNRISWANGVPKTSASTSLTITVTGTLTEMLLEDVQSQVNPNPSENVPITGAPTNYSYADGVRYYAYGNGNTVDAGGVVTEAKGSPITGWYALFEPVDDGTAMFSMANIDAAQGMIVFEMEQDVILAGDHPLISPRALSLYGAAYWDDGKIRANDGSTSSGTYGSLPLQAGIACQMATGWGQDDKMWCGGDSSGAWLFGPLTNFDGAMFVNAAGISIFNIDGGNAFATPSKIKNLLIYPSDQGTAWVAEHFP